MKKLIFLSLFMMNAFAEVTPTERVAASLSFTDDMDFKNLDLAIERQLEGFKRTGLKGEISFGDEAYPKTILKDSLLLLRKLAGQTKYCFKYNPRDFCQKEFDRQVNEQFMIFKPIPNKAALKDLTTKFTSYYSPDLVGSRTQTARFKNPIYSLPSSVDRNFTRVDIDYKGALAGKGYEIFWVEQSLFDLYLLHVQGGGRITIQNPNGTTEVKYLSFAGSNKRPFQMIYKYMLQKGYLKPSEAGIPSQRKFLTENPDKQEEIFGVCPSYVYFKESSHEPIGLDDISLTEGRSVALDSTIYKTTGLINFVKTKRAVLNNERITKIPFSRFFISQDTGGAIKGNARCDLYFGYGPAAELTAYNMNDMGEQYFLIKE